MQVEWRERKWNIILDDALISWIQGVLQTAARSNWRIPKGCVKSSGGRSIHIGSAINRQGQYIQISEQASNGRTFKEIIPEDRHRKGWAPIIFLLSEFYREELRWRIRNSYGTMSTEGSSDAESGSGRHLWKSYAEAVKGGGFYGAGKCTIMGHVSERYIDVGKEGVQERCEYLGRSLIIRWCANQSFTASDIPSFRRWAVRNWAIDDNFAIEDRSDGSWFLVCPSVAEALRIKKLNHLFFRGVKLEITSWTEEEVAPCGEVTWILATDIPLHLKSVELIKTIGNFCGDFLEIDWNLWCFPFVRIRIRKVRVIPDKVILKFGNQSIVVGISVPPVKSLSQRTSHWGRQRGTRMHGGVESEANRCSPQWRLRNREEGYI
ncbi:unnamed protein product [Linum trigynum]|uniref:DUF4283 domain-containing protein n=1 Tax=Linum trigynum TaxID=586398 RepID=A0AAV2DQA9_9ROSI